MNLTERLQEITAVCYFFHTGLLTGNSGEINARHFFPYSIFSVNSPFMKGLFSHRTGGKTASAFFRKDKTYLR